MLRISLAKLCLIITFCEPNLFADDSPVIDFQPFTLETRGGPIPAQKGWLTVPENRYQPNGRTIRLPVVLIKAQNPANKGEPITYLAGGPGGSAIRGAGLVAAVLQGLNQNHDIVLMDQRGTGEAEPRLLFPASEPFPPDGFADWKKAEAYGRALVMEAVDHFRKQGIDLSAYNSEESADDLNDLRTALGAEKLSLIGFSYGTHLGLATIRRHGDHIQKAVLVGVEGPDHTYKLPLTYNAQMRKLSNLAAEDPKVGPQVPDMYALYQKLRQKLASQPIQVPLKHPRSGETVNVLFGAPGLDLITRLDIGDGNDFPEFPALFHAMDRGDMSLLTKYVAKRYFMLGRGISMMAQAMDLSSSVSSERWARIQRENPQGILGGMTNLFMNPREIETLGLRDLGEAYRSPLHSSVKTLFISGSLDSNTPPHQAEEVRWGFTNGVHLVVENAGHEDMLPHPEVQSAILDFFAGKDVRGRHIALPKPRFVPIAGAGE